MITDTRNAYHQKWLFAVLIFLLFSLAGCMSTGSGKAPHVTPLTDIVWQWVETHEQTSSEKTTVPNPEKYTIIFLEDGTYRGMADCNLIRGSYAQEEGFKIASGPSTMAYCGEQSLDRKYLKLLGLAETGGLDGNGNLVLNSIGGANRIVFRNGGVAP